MPENIDKSSKVVAAKECNKGVASGGVTKPGCGGSSVKGQPSREGEVISDWRDCVPESPPKGEEGSKGRPCERKAKGEGIEAGGETGRFSADCGVGQVARSPSEPGDKEESL